jgi:hypothetical protein
MKPIKPYGANVDFVEPKEWDEGVDGKCDPLPIRREAVGIRNYLYSAWELEPGDLDTLQAGGVVELLCVGVQPPVALRVIPHPPGPKRG